MRTFAAALLSASLVIPTSAPRLTPVLPHPAPVLVRTAVRRPLNLAGKRRPMPKPPVVWSRTFVSVFGGPGEIQSVAGPYPNTGVMNRNGPLYFAHRSLPFGTRIRFRRGSRECVAVCADRGPAAWTGHTFDLGSNTAHALGMSDGDEAWVEWSK
jgi:hypothetical protein